MLRSESLFGDRDGAPVEAQRLVGAAGPPGDRGELPERGRDVGVVGAESRFDHGEALLEILPGLGVVFEEQAGAAEAVKQAGKSGQVFVTGLSTPNDMKAYVEDGTVKSVVLWNTRDLGYLTSRVGEAVATGKLKPGATTFEAGRLGAKKIDGDNVLLGDMLVFTKDNIDGFDF